MEATGRHLKPAGSTCAKNVKKILARLAFLEVITKDQRVVDLWRIWREYTGLNDSGSALGRTIDQLAVSAGLVDQGQLRKIYDTGSEAEIAAPDERFSADQVEIADEALAAFGLCLDRLYDRREASASGPRGRPVFRDCRNWGLLCGWAGWRALGITLERTDGGVVGSRRGWRTPRGVCTRSGRGKL